MDQAIGRNWPVWMADTVLKKFPKLSGKWSYDFGVVCKGMQAAYEVTGDERYFEYIKNVMDNLISEDGIFFYEKEQYNLDNINNGKILIYLYKKTGDERYVKMAGLLRSQLEKQPRTSGGGFWHKKVYPNQMWLDGIYMAQPFYAEYIRDIEKSGDFSDVIRQFDLIEEHLRDEKTGLLYHGWDESGESFWADKDSGVSSSFWGRSIGWYACALVDTLDFLTDPKDISYLTFLVRELAKALREYQSQKTGVWSQVVDKEYVYGNYYECSSSCMFVYFLKKAINKGYIGDEYEENVRRGFFGIVREFIEVDRDGCLSLHGTVYGAGLGGDGLRDGTYDYYVSEPRQTDHLHGVGAFLMAAAEQTKALNIT